MDKVENFEQMYSDIQALISKALKEIIIDKNTLGNVQNEHPAYL